MAQATGLSMSSRSYRCTRDLRTRKRNIHRDFSGLLRGNSIISRRERRDSLACWVPDHRRVWRHFSKPHCWHYKPTYSPIIVNFHKTFRKELPYAGSKQWCLKPRFMIYAPSYAWRRDAKHNPRRSFWTVALCSRLARVARVLGTMGPNARRDQKLTWRWTRWAIW